MRSITVLFSILLSFAITWSAQAQQDASWHDERPPAWAYDPGPDTSPNNLMAAELINLNASIPFFPGISEQIMRGGKQKFRPAFGPIPWRMILQPNSVKILFIGQDGTHIAEAAGRPATAGFGGRAQDLAKFFGVEYSAGFINTYAFTIKGQYGGRGAPYMMNNNELRSTTIIPNDVWLMSQDQKSPIVKWRNNLIEWIIQNNKESLKMVVLFGGSAKDSIASFIESRGGKVGSRNERYMSSIQVPMFKLVNSGGNGEFPVAVNSRGRDFYSQVLGRKLNYKNQKDQQAVLDNFFTRKKKSSESKAQYQQYLKAQRAQQKKFIDEMVFTKAGPYGSGIHHHAQLGGYNLDKIYVDRDQPATRSLKGLKLSDGSTIDDHILVVALPHPTYLSGTMRDTAIAEEKRMLKEALATLNAGLGAGETPKKLTSKQKRAITNAAYRVGKTKVANLVERDVKKLRKYNDVWKIQPDIGLTNSFAQGKKYNYGRSDIHNVYYDFGTPKNRMVSKSTARRNGGQVIVLGSRDVPKYDRKKMSAMKKQKPNSRINRNEMYVARARGKDSRYVFDPGPPVEYAKLMKKLNMKSLLKAKSGKNFSKHGIDAYYVKSHPDVGNFGHYRGTFKFPKVLILADPDGYDDLITARALTGTRGQYLQGLMNRLGVNDQYLLLKTVPVGMDGASDEDWQYVMDKSESYRQTILTQLLEDHHFDLILSDGDWAKSAMSKALENSEQKKRWVFINRQGLANGSGIERAHQYIKSKTVFKNIEPGSSMANIPKEHLTYYSRIWEGTSGDRVLNANGPLRGLAFLEVAPAWAAYHKAKFSSETEEGIDDMLKQLTNCGFPMPDEKISSFIKRRGNKDINVCDDAA